MCRYRGGAASKAGLGGGSLDARLRGEGHEEGHGRGEGYVVWDCRCGD
jgi:hypothetical protein